MAENRVTQLAGLALTENTAARVRLTQVAQLALTENTQAAARCTQLALLVLTDPPPPVIIRVPSNAVFPLFPGLAWSVDRAPIWKTTVQTAGSGKESRSSWWSYPVWEWTFTYEFLRAGGSLVEYETLVGFFNAHQGQFDSFRYEDPDDHSVTDQSFGLGDGATTAFQLVRTLGGFTEPVRELNGTPAITVNGVVQATGITISSTGVVTFASAPAAGAVLTWTGNFYFRCRFAGDSQTLSQFQHLLWTTKSLKIRSVK